MHPNDLELLYSTLPARDNRPPEYAIRLLEETCARTGLDWKMRHVYLMNRGGKWQVTLSIDGFRLVGSQDAEYAGQEGPFWVVTSDGTWTDIPPDGAIYASKVGIKHRNGTVTWGTAKFKDYAAGPMWQKFPSTMIAKCAEMLAWRKAMPGRLGGLYGLEEMQQADKPKTRTAEKSEATVMDSPGNLGLADAGGDYIISIANAKDLEALKAVGAAIMKSGLPEPVVARLHAEYNSRKEALRVG